MSPRRNRGGQTYPGYESVFHKRIPNYPEVRVRRAVANRSKTFTHGYDTSKWFVTKTRHTYFLSMASPGVTAWSAMLTGSVTGDFQGPVMADRWCTKGVCFPIVSYGIATTDNGDLAATISAADSASTRQKPGQEPYRLGPHRNSQEVGLPAEPTGGCQLGGGRLLSGLCAKENNGTGSKRPYANLALTDSRLPSLSSLSSTFSIRRSLTPPNPTVPGVRARP